ncbi:pilus assembly protein TadG-related protein [Asticcacaulis sp. AC402]|uniref:pilus assembly protein TadG-related protein n=1 Tax=Asticcacaulis sp. AC402 TaxID=1282361 RepID=UPI0003C3BD9D|nr:pilus assembly protein TadG-related protein [Asticcacaulis sp. AC402]ESQ73597.1 von Willebrand factor A [Asticcacaulis sp. AC402]
MRHSLNAFLTSRAGNTTMIFGLAIFAILGALGTAVDYAVLQRAKRSSQDALDAAVLAAAIVNNSNETDLKKLAGDIFKENLNDDKLNVTVTAFKYDSKARTVNATARGTYDPIIMQLFGFKNLPYSVTSNSIKAADGALEVALVLDNTWSMSATLNGTPKIDVLKTAAQNLVATILTKDNKDYVKVAVVPYADYVNIGLSNRNASWVSVGADYSTTSTKTCKTVTTGTQCTGGTKGTCTGNQDGVPYTYSCWKVPQTCKTVNVTPYQSCSGGGTTNYKWYGCVRNQIASSKLVMPDPATPYAGILQTSQTCLNPVLALSNDATTVTNSIKNLVVNIGSYKPETYIPAGMIWGVNALSPPLPFAEGKAYDNANKEPRKTIVLMTDGANTLYANTSGGIAVANSTQVAVTYADQIRVCDYAKSKNIEIYTIGFDVTDAKALTTLKACATDAQHYFDAKSSADLIKAFETIGGKLSKVRLTQ